jgi:hypothetical protein
MQRVAVVSNSDARDHHGSSRGVRGQLLSCGGYSAAVAAVAGHVAVIIIISDSCDAQHERDCQDAECMHSKKKQKK